MLRTCLWIALIAIICTIRLSNASNSSCASATFSQDLNAIQMAAAQIITDDYTTSTGDQIIAKLKELFDEPVMNINWTITKTDKSINIAYKIIYACNETTTTVLSDGTTKTTEVKSKANQTKVNEAISCGLTDRANHISLRAQQVSSGANDTLCHFNFGSDNLFEWTIETSLTTYSSALSTGSFKTNESFYNALSTYFRTRLNTLYPNQIANVSFVSQNTLANRRQALTFRVYFAKTILDISLRTQIVSSIQTTYYEIIKNYFASVSKSIKIPTSVKIDVPSAVSTTTKTAILFNEVNSSFSLLSGLQFNLTKILSSTSSDKMGDATKQSLGSSIKIESDEKSDEPETSKNMNTVTGTKNGVLTVSTVATDSKIPEATKLSINALGTGGNIVATSQTRPGTGDAPTQIIVPTLTKTGILGGSASLTVGNGATKDSTTSTTTAATTTTTHPTTTTTATTQPTTTTTQPTTTTTHPTTTTTQPTTTTTHPTTTTTQPTTTTTQPTTTTTQPTTTTTQPTTTTTTTTQPTTTTTQPTTTTTQPTTTTTQPTTTTTQPTTTTTQPTTTTTQPTTTTTTTTQPTTTTTQPTTTTTQPTTTTTQPTTTTTTTTQPTTTTTQPTTTTTTTTQPTTTTTQPTTTTTQPTTTTTQPTTTTTQPTTQPTTTTTQPTTTTTQPTTTTTQPTTTTTTTTQPITTTTQPTTTTTQSTTTTTTTTQPTTTTTQPTTTTTQPTTTTTQPTTTTTQPTTTTTQPTTTTTQPTTTITQPTTTTTTTAAPTTQPTTTTTTTTTTESTTTTTTEPTTTTTTTTEPTTTTTTEPTTTTTTTTEPTTTTTTEPTATTSTTEPTTTTTTTTESTTTTTTEPTTTTTTTTEPTTTTTTEPTATTSTTEPTTTTTTTTESTTTTTTEPTTTTTTTTEPTTTTTTEPTATTSTTEPTTTTTIAPSIIMATPTKTTKTTNLAKNKKVNAGVTRETTTQAPKTTKGIKITPPSVHTVIDNKKVKVTVTSDKQNKQRKNKSVRKILSKPFGQPRDIIDVSTEIRPYQFKSINTQNNYARLLASLFRRRFIQSSSSKTQSPGCGRTDIYVNYIYEYDIHDQAFNSSFQDTNSIVFQRLQADISDWTSEEFYNRNLIAYILDKARLTKIIDVTKQYNNRPTIRIYISINTRKNLIATIRRVFEFVFEKLQKERFSTSKANPIRDNMVIIPIRK